MTLPEFYSPKQLSPAQLDAFLARGWYRMHQNIFTTNYIADEARYYRVFWLRYNLSLYRASKKSQQLVKKNSIFKHVIKPFKLTSEIEKLYALYRSDIDFDGAPSVTEWLFNGKTGNIYDTYLSEVRDGKKLIAAGVFDKGENSLAGIMNFFNPEYKKFSPGKYLILTKIDFALQNNMLWYYPGYLVHEYPKFDYKLFAGSEFAEIYVPELKTWFPYSETLMKSIANADN